MTNLTFELCHLSFSSCPWTGEVTPPLQPLPLEPWTDTAYRAPTPEPFFSLPPPDLSGTVILCRQLLIGQNHLLHGDLHQHDV
jgi:hypothetical protein